MDFHRKRSGFMLLFGDTEATSVTSARRASYITNVFWLFETPYSLEKNSTAVDRMTFFCALSGSKQQLVPNAPKHIDAHLWSLILNF